MVNIISSNQAFAGANDVDKARILTFPPPPMVGSHEANITARIVATQRHMSPNMRTLQKKDGQCHSKKRGASVQRQNQRAGGSSLPASKSRATAAAVRSKTVDSKNKLRENEVLQGTRFKP